MTEFYSQSVEVSVSSKTKSMQWIGISAILASLGFVMLAIFLSPYYSIGAVALFVIGALYLHFYNTTSKEFTYEFTPTRLVVVKKDLLGKQRRMLTLMLSDVTEFAIMEGLSEERDVAACGAAYEQGVYQIIYKDGETLRRLLFLPDDYMIALLRESLGAKCDKTYFTEEVAENADVKDE